MSENTGYFCLFILNACHQVGCLPLGWILKIQKVVLFLFFVVAEDELRGLTA